jgi:hypothetical protein
LGERELAPPTGQLVTVELHCCEAMADSADSLPELDDVDAWRQSLIVFDPAKWVYGLALSMAGSFGKHGPVYEPINFCPWCGTPLPAFEHAGPLT